MPQRSIAEDSATASFSAFIGRLLSHRTTVSAPRPRTGRRPESPREERQEPLSVREREIVVCIVKGMSNKQIADTLCISTHTVITHRRNIVAKLQIHSPAGLTIYAIVNKLVDLSEIRDTITEI